jgi:ABC-type multidrug transport system fused ATPase/permease subunit
MERINEYSHLKSEDIWTDKQVSLREAPNGKIEFRRVSLKYREHDDPVLHGVSFCVESGQKVGIVGRTGAGKTSLTSLLFRLVEPFEGTILIGDVDTKRYGVHLRRILTIIPQDPFLFCGSLKANLDPFNEYTVEEIWNALDKANLSDFVRNLTNGLDYEITDGGSNLRYLKI